MCQVAPPRVAASMSPVLVAFALGVGFVYAPSSQSAMTEPGNGSLTDSLPSFTAATATGGSRIVFECRRDGSDGIHIMNADGSGQLASLVTQQVVILPACRWGGSGHGASSKSKALPIPK